MSLAYLEEQKELALKANATNKEEVVTEKKERDPYAFQSKSARELGIKDIKFFDTRSQNKEDTNPKNIGRFSFTIETSVGDIHVRDITVRKFDDRKFPLVGYPGRIWEPQGEDRKVWVRSFSLPEEIEAFLIRFAIAQTGDALDNLEV